MAFDGTLKFDTKIDQSGFESGLSKLGSIAQKGMAVVAGAVTATAGAMTAIGVKALEAYADYEQLTGGVATLFGAQDMSLEQYAKSIGKSTDAAKAQYDKLLAAQSAVFSNASKAFKTAGLSQNEYMETVTSFSAALIASLKGDTEKAARVADMAITDMSDNANKMGSSMESIQNAYQGFAKQNYTMLDNLKLGYGGTKSEMQRLLADAQAISGVKYNLDSYADVVEAIHVIQTEMHISGITAEEAAEAVRNGTMTEAEAFAAMGTTAKEAQSTIQGSLAMTKAAWQNLLVGIADDSADFDKLINDLVESATAAGRNLIPRVEQAINGAGRAIEKLLPIALNKVPEIIVKGVPGVVSATKNLVAIIFDSAQNLLADTDWGSLGGKIAGGFNRIDWVTLFAGAAQILGNALVATLDLLTGFVENVDWLKLGQKILYSVVAIVENIDWQEVVATAFRLLGAAIGGAGALIGGLSVAIKSIIESVKADLKTYFDTKIKEAGGNVVEGIFNGIIDAMNGVNSWIEQNIVLPIINGFKAGFGIHSPSTVMMTMGKYVVDGLLNGVKNAPSRVLAIFTEIKSKIVSWGSDIKTRVKNIGENLVKGLWNGINDMKNWVIAKVKGFGTSVLDGIKKALGIASPSKITKGYGRYLAQGLGIGFAAEMPQIGKAAAQMIHSMKLPRPKVSIDSAAVEALNLPSSGLLGGMLRPSPTSEVVNSSVANTYASTNNTYHQTLTFNQPIRTPSQVARAARKALEVT